MTTEHQPGSTVDIDELEREGHEWDHGQLLRAARSLCAELRTLRARVAELEQANARPKSRTPEQLEKEAFAARIAAGERRCPSCSAPGFRVGSECAECCYAEKAGDR